MDPIAARIRALEIAIENAPNGTKWDAVIGNADKFAKFLISGTVPAKEE